MPLRKLLILHSWFLEKAGFVRYSYGGENSREDTLRCARNLGLRNEEGEVNFDVLKAFGAYAQETYLSGDANHADLQTRLYGLFPEFVKAPAAENNDSSSSG